MSSTAAEQKAGLFGQSAKALIEAGNSGGTSAFAWFVPGRIEVLGKHTDYAGGRSLTAAIERGVLRRRSRTERQQSTGDRIGRASTCRVFAFARPCAVPRPLVELPDDCRPPCREELWQTGAATRGIDRLRKRPSRPRPG